MEGSREEGQELAGGPVGPVEVFEYEDERLVVAQLLDEIGDGFVEAASITRATPTELDELGHPGRLHGAAQGRRERGEGERVVTEVETATDQYGGSRCLGKRRELLDQPGLADPCFAADEHDAGTAGPGFGETFGEQRALIFASDEDRAQLSHCHDVEHAMRR